MDITTILHITIISSYNMEKKLNVIFMLLIFLLSFNLISASHYYNYPKSTSNYYNSLYYDGEIYNSKSLNYNSYYQYYPEYFGKNYYEKSYHINSYYPYYSYEYIKEYKESKSPYIYSKYEKISSRRISRPETYLILWGYR